MPPNGRVLIADGGLYRITPGPENTGITASAELYDPATGKFLTTGAMMTARMLHYAVALNDGDVLIVGGVTGGGTDRFFGPRNYLGSVELYNSGQGRFTSLLNIGDDKIPASNGSAVLLSNGMALIAGGVDGDGVISNARLYDSAQSRFLPTGSMMGALSGYAAARLNNGQVLVTGGIGTIRRHVTLDWPGPTAVASAELYDPKLGVFFSLPDMATPRVGHTATLLSDGNVLVVGGVRAGFAASSSAELFRPASVAGQVFGEEPSRCFSGREILGFFAAMTTQRVADEALPSSHP